MKAKDYEAQQKHQFPDQPWMWEKKWDNGQVKSDDKLILYFLLVFALIWNAISWPIVPDVLQQARGKPEAYVVLLFPAIGVLIAFLFIKQLFRYRKFGHSVLHFHTMPGVIGGAFEGEVVIPCELRPEKGFEVTVNCKRYTPSRGNNSSSSTSILWQRTMKLNGEVIRQRVPSTVVRIYCAIPFGGAPTQDLRGGGRIYWEVQVKADVVGANFGSQYTIPVYETDESREDFVADEQKIREIVFDPDETDRDVMAAEGLVEQREMGKWSLYFPAGRHKTGSKILFIFAIAVVGVPIGLLMHFGLQIPLYGACIIGGGVFVTSWVLWYIWLWQVCYRSTIWVENGRVNLRGGAIKMTEKQFMLDEVKAISMRRGMQTNDSLYYRIILRTQDDKPHQVAGQIPGVEMAEKIVKLLEAELGVTK